MQKLMVWPAFLMVFAATTLPAQPNARKAKEIKAANDAHGDPLPKGAVQRYGTLRFRTPSNIVALAWSPDGKVIAASGVDRSVCLFERATGKFLHRLSGHGGAPGFIRFSPVGERLATADASGTLNVWETSTGKKCFSLNEPAFLYSRNGKILFTGGTKLAVEAGRLGIYEHLALLNSTKTMRTWDATTGKELMPFGIGVPIAVSADGKHLASLTGFDGIEPLILRKVKTQTIIIWETATGKSVAKIELDLAKGWVHHGRFSGGEFIYRLYNSKPVSAWVWPWRAKQAPRPLINGPRGTLPFHISADGKSAFVVKKDAIVALNTKTGRQIQQFDNVKTVSEAQRVAVSPDHKEIVTGGGGNALTIWDLKSRKISAGGTGHKDRVRALALTPDRKRLLAVSDDGTIRSWDIKSGRELNCRFVSLLATTYFQMAFSSDGRRLAIPNGREATVLSVNNDHKQRDFALAKGDATRTVAMSSADKLIGAGTWKGALALWDMQSGKRLWQKEISRNATIVDLTFAPDAKSVATMGTDHMIRIIDAVTAKQTRQIQFGVAPRVGVLTDAKLAYSQDSRMVTCLNQKEIRCFEVVTGQERARIAMPHSSATFAFSPDGRYVATGFFDAELGRAKQTSTSQIPEPYGISLWDVATQKEVHRFMGHRGEVTALLFGAAGERLYSGSDDTTILAWKIPPHLIARKPVKMADTKMQQLWDRLAANDATDAFTAQHQLSAAENLAEFMARHLQPAAQVDPKLITQWIGDLNSERFATRTKAERNLGNHIEQAELALRKALKKPDSLESHQRIERLLEQLKTPEGKRLQALRSLEVLEWTATPAARKLAARLARGLPAARLTHEARETLKRMR